MKSTTRLYKTDNKGMLILNNGRKMSAKAREKQNEYRKKFIKNTYRRYSLRLKLNDDKEMINYLNSKENLNAYIKELVIKDMNK